LTAAAVLKNGDVIKFGTNFVGFNERKREHGDEPVTPAFQGQVRAAPPPPPVKTHTAPAQAGNAKPAATPKPAPSQPAAPPAGAHPGSTARPIGAPSIKPP